jgi:hypothetical protein
MALRRISAASETDAANVKAPVATCTTLTIITAGLLSHVHVDTERSLAHLKVTQSHYTVLIAPGRRKTGVVSYRRAASRIVAEGTQLVSRL